MALRHSRLSACELDSRARSGARWSEAPLRNRTVDLLLTMSIPGRNSTAAMLVRTGFVIILVPVNVPGFRPVLARVWHDVFVLNYRRLWRRAVVAKAVGLRCMDGSRQVDWRCEEGT